MHIPHGRHHHGPKPTRVYGRSPGHSPESVYPYPMDRRRRGYNRVCGKFCEGGRASPKDVGLIMLVLLLTAVAVGGLFLVIFFVVADSDSVSPKEGKLAAGELVSKLNATDSQKVEADVRNLDKDLQKLGNDILHAVEDETVAETEYDHTKTKQLSDDDDLTEEENDVAESSGGRPVFVPRPPGPYEPSIPPQTTPSTTTTLFPGFTPEAEEDSRKRTHSVNVPEPSSSAGSNPGSAWWNVFFGEEPTTPRTRGSTPSLSVVVPQAPIVPPSVVRAGSSGILDAAIGIASRPSTTTQQTTTTSTSTTTTKQTTTSATTTEKQASPSTTQTSTTTTQQKAEPEFHDPIVEPDFVPFGNHHDRWMPVSSSTSERGLPSTTRPTTTTSSTTTTQQSPTSQQPPFIRGQRPPYSNVPFRRPASNVDDESDFSIKLEPEVPFRRPQTTSSTSTTTTTTSTTTKPTTTSTSPSTTASTTTSTTFKTPLTTATEADYGSSGSGPSGDGEEYVDNEEQSGPPAGFGPPSLPPLPPQFGRPGRFPPPRLVPQEPPRQQRPPVDNGNNFRVVDGPTRFKKPINVQVQQGSRFGPPQQPQQPINVPTTEREPEFIDVVVGGSQGGSKKRFQTDEELGIIHSLDKPDWEHEAPEFEGAAQDGGRVIVPLLPGNEGGTTQRILDPSLYLDSTTENLPTSPALMLPADAITKGVRPGTNLAPQRRPSRPSGGSRFRPPAEIEKGGFSLVNDAPGRPVIEEESLFAGRPSPATANRPVEPEVAQAAAPAPVEKPAEAPVNVQSRPPLQAGNNKIRGSSVEDLEDIGPILQLLGSNAIIPQNNNNLRRLIEQVNDTPQELVDTGKDEEEDTKPSQVPVKPQQQPQRPPQQQPSQRPGPPANNNGGNVAGPRRPPIPLNPNAPNFRFPPQFTGGPNGAPLPEVSSGKVRWPLLPNRIPVRGPNQGPPRGKCYRRSLPFCREALPYPFTTYPNLLGRNSPEESQADLPFISIITTARCNPLVQPFVCTVLEPFCSQGKIKPPCKQFCERASKGCEQYLVGPGAAKVFDCSKYPDSTDPAVCIDFAPTGRRGELPIAVPLNRRRGRDTDGEESAFQSRMGLAADEEEPRPEIRAPVRQARENLDEALFQRRRQPTEWLGGFRPLQEYVEETEKLEKQSPILTTGIKQNIEPKQAAVQVGGGLSFSSPLHLSPSAVRSPVFPTRPSTQLRAPQRPRPGARCEARSVPFCKGDVLPYNYTIVPNPTMEALAPRRSSPGQQNQQQTQTHRYHDTFPYFQMVAQSNCNPRISQFLCSLLEPECGPQTPIKPPCRKFCRSAIEGCAEFIVPGLELSTAFDCRVYPDSYDSNECINMARGEHCLVDEFQCPEDNSCIPRSWLCDGVQDCPSAADEMNCTKCAHDEFKCAVQHACIPDRWRCDGSPDCIDGSDETGCEILRQECGDGMFQCKDGIDCVPYRWRCDGTNQCRDNSDEADCQDLSCHGDDFKCASNGICIPNVWVCDGRPDCADGTDEKNCRNKQKPQKPHRPKPSQWNESGPKVSRPPAFQQQEDQKRESQGNKNKHREEEPTFEEEIPPAKENGIENRAGFVDRGPLPAADVDQAHLIIQPGSQPDVALKPIVGYQSPWSWEPKYDRRRRR